MRLIFQILIGASAFFIAGCSAYFSVKGLGLLFAGSAVAVMVMAASLEIGKLVAASFLYQYWSRITIAVRIYLMLAVAVLVGITSLGIYGYLARAYERTNSDVALLQKQIESIQQEMVDTNARIQASRSQLGKLSDADRQDIEKLQQQIVQVNQSFEQSLLRLDERRKAAREKRDKLVEKLQQQTAQSSQTLDQSLARIDARRKAVREKQDKELELLASRAAEATKLLTAALASEDAEINAINERVQVLDRAVDAYTKQGGPGFLKNDGVRMGQELREQQKKERDSLAAQVATHRAAQDQLRAAHANTLKEIDRQTADARERFTKDSALVEDEDKTLRKNVIDNTQAVEAKIATAGEALAKESAPLDDEEKSLRKSHDDTLAAAQAQLAALQTKGTALVADGGNQIEAMYQRLRTGDQEIGRLREQIAATDVGSYRFVARAFNAPVDDVVKWLIFIIVLVFDPLAVALTIGFNVALRSDKRRSIALDASGDAASSAPVASTPTTPARRASIAVASIVVGTLLIGGAGYLLVSVLRHQSRVSHAQAVPADSFAVMTLNPAMLRQTADQKTDAKPGALMQPLSLIMDELSGPGFDREADVYAFAKYPSERSDKPTDRPVMICGLVVRVADVAAAESALSRCADKITAAIRPAGNNTGAITHSRLMVQHGDGRYLDPEGGFFTFGLTKQEAVLLLEVSGDPARPRVEQEIRSCLVRSDSAPRAARASHSLALPAGSAVSLWFDAARCFSDMPKSAAAQARYQQLQRLLDFDLSLVIVPDATGKVRVVGQYAYTGERFREGSPPPLDLLAKLGPSEAAGIPGRLMDRCADTLDFDSLIDRLRMAMSNTAGGTTQVVVEKNAPSVRDGNFVLTAQYDAKNGAPLALAFRSLSLF